MRAYSSLARSMMLNNQSMAGYFQAVLLTRMPATVPDSAPQGITALLGDLGYTELADSHYTVPAERPTVQTTQSTSGSVKNLLLGSALVLPADVPPTYIAGVAFAWRGTDAAGTSPILGGVTNPWMMITDETFGQIVYPGSSLSTVSTAPSILWSWTSRTTEVDITSTGLLRSPGTVPWEPPRTQHVFLYPQRVNYVPNPSFEDVGRFGWRAKGTFTRVVGGVDNASNFIGRVVGANTRLESIPALLTSRFVCVSAHVRSASGGPWAQIGLCNYSAAWTASPDVLSEQKPLVDTWTRLSYIAQMPDNLAGSGFLVVANGGFDIDLVMLEASADLNDYFAGDSQTGILGDFSWQGTTHQSLSFWYNNKYLVGARLFGTYTTGLVQKNGLVYDWVPAGTSIYTHWDVLSTNDTKQPLEDFASKVIP